MLRLLAAENAAAASDATTEVGSTQRIFARCASAVAAKVDKALEMEEDAAAPRGAGSGPRLGDWLRDLQLQDMEPVLQEIAASPLDIKLGFEAGLLNSEMLVAQGFNKLQVARLGVEAKKLQIPTCLSHCLTVLYRQT